MHGAGVISDRHSRTCALCLKFSLNGVTAEPDPTSELYGNTIYNDPLASANKTAWLLKNELDCDYVICLSHLGFKYENSKISDHTLAASSSDIDLILGGHTHTFLREAIKLPNALGEDVIVNQVGWAGLLLGRLDIVFERNRKGKCTTCTNTKV